MDSRTRPVDKHKFRSFWDKADELYSMMKIAEEEEKWNAAAINAIHCAICASDALCTFVLGKRSAGQRHEDAASVIKDTRLPGADEKAKQFLDITNLKTLVEYSDEAPSEKNARRMILQTERFYAWVKSNLKL